MEYNNSLPIYLQIVDLIKKQLVKDKLVLGEKLPSTREMAKKMKVNPNTISRVYRELEMSDITFTKRGMGTYITEDTIVIEKIKRDMANEILTDFIIGMKSIGFKKEEILKMIKNYEEVNDVIKND